MATVDDSGFISGSVGPVVFYLRNGVKCARAKPDKYRDKKTKKQLMWRGRFTECNRFYDLTQDTVFRQVWKVIAHGTGKSAKNLFIQHSIYAFGKEEGVVDYERLHFSAGSLPLPDGLRLERYNKRDCLLQWKYDRAKAIGAPDDRLYIVELQAAMNVRIHATGICRHKGEASFSTFHDIDDQTHLYCFWGNEAGSAFSDSLYLHSSKPVKKK